MVHWQFWKEPEPPGPDEHIYNKWRNELVIQVAPVLVIFIIFYVWFLVCWILDQVLLGILPGFFAFCMYAVFRVTIKDQARDKYGQYRLCKETVHESSTRHWRDYFALRKLERLNPNDRRVQAAREFMAKLQQRRRELHDRRLPKSLDAAANPGKDPPNAPAQPAPELPPFGLVAEVYLAEFAFRDEDDPWRQQLWLSDVDAERHLHPVVDTAYVGNIGVKGPVYEFSVAWTGEGIGGVPLCLFVDSKENIDRIQGGLNPLRANPVDVTRAAELHDFWLSVELVKENEGQAKEIVSLEQALDFYRAQSGREAERLYQERKRYEKQPGLKLDRKLILRIAKYGVIIAVVIVAAWVGWQVARAFLPWLGAILYRGGVEPPIPRQARRPVGREPVAAPPSAPEVPSP